MRAARPAGLPARRWSDARSEDGRKELAFDALEASGWNQSEAAFRIDYRRERLCKKLKEWGGRDGLTRAVQAIRHKRASITGDTGGTPGTGVTGDGVVTRDIGEPGDPESAVMLSGPQRVTYVDPVPILRGMSSAWGIPEGATARIPAITVQPDAEEDLFISHEIAIGRLTGGSRTRTAVVKDALRFYMKAKAQEPESNGGGE